MDSNQLVDSGNQLQSSVMFTSAGLTTKLLSPPAKNAEVDVQDMYELLADATTDWILISTLSHTSEETPSANATFYHLLGTQAGMGRASRQPASAG